MKRYTEVALECQSRIHPIPPSRDLDPESPVREKDRPHRRFDV
jgi:hypothetical protein